MIVQQRQYLSIVIPAKNEQEGIKQTLDELTGCLTPLGWQFEILVVDDHSTDATSTIVSEMSDVTDRIRLLSNSRIPGFGSAVKFGIDAARGEVIAIYMADGSDDPCDLVKFVEVLEAEKTDAVFGDRFGVRRDVPGYPKAKLFLNRVANNVLSLLFDKCYSDWTNAFKLYRRETLSGLMPLVADHFDLTVELSLKTSVRGYSYSVVPNSWRSRKSGQSSFRLLRLIWPYSKIALRCWAEKRNLNVPATRL